MTGAQLDKIGDTEPELLPFPHPNLQKEHPEDCPGGRRHSLPSILPTWGQGAGKPLTTTGIAGKEAGKRWPWDNKPSFLTFLVREQLDTKHTNQETLSIYKENSYFPNSLTYRSVYTMLTESGLQDCLVSPFGHS